MRLFLPPLVGFCSIGDSVIVLDARSDRYWMLPTAVSQALNRHCAGAELAGDEAAPLLALVRFGLLQSAKGEPLVPCQLPRARTSRLEVIDTTPGSSTMIAGLCFAASTWRIRRRGLACNGSRCATRRAWDRWTGRCSGDGNSSIPLPSTSLKGRRPYSRSAPPRSAAKSEPIALGRLLPLA